MHIKEQKKMSRRAPTKQNQGVRSNAAEQDTRVHGKKGRSLDYGTE